MISFGNFWKEIAFIATELANFETPRFRGQKEEFPCCISTVEQLLPRNNI